MRATRLLASLSLAAVLGGCGSGGRSTSGGASPSRPRPLAVYAGGERIEVLRPGRPHSGLPHRIVIRRGRARLELAVRLHPALRRVRRALAAHEARVDVPVVPLRTTIALRPVRQVLHNDCEATSLSMLLAAAGIRAGQLRLQARLPRSGPLDPESVPGSGLFRWGDPERGFVGRPAGGGPEGGFGVYEPPVRALAARYGVHLLDLHGRTVTAVRDAVLAGHPVLAWVGLAAGPYLSWLTPSGREITVNLDEHAVVLVGAGPDYVLVNNPLTGRRERWSEDLFSYRWKLLGRRALELPRY
ncbi:MAG: C39 family peptidase [Gaiellaceae bacterium]